MAESKEVFVEGHLSDKDFIFSLYRDTSTNHYFWKYKGKPVRLLEGKFTSKAKALRVYEMWLKRSTKPYPKQTRERFNGNPDDPSWRLPPPYKTLEGLESINATCI